VSLLNHEDTKIAKATKERSSTGFVFFVTVVTFVVDVHAPKN
jgi:hypothetical protein